MLVDILRLIVAGYLIALALSLSLGVGRPLMTYPGRVAYSFIRILFFVFTLGRVNIKPLSRRARRRYRWRRRQWRRVYSQWRMDKNESEEIRRGEAPSRWASSKD